MPRHLCCFALCLSLIVFPTVSMAQAQEIATIPVNQSGPTLQRASSPVILPEGTEVHFVLLDSISSASATKGQSVHFAIAQDEVSVFPPGTIATGVVKSVRRGIPGKRNGSLELEPRTIRLANGTTLKLVRSTEDCQITIPGCWVFFALGTTAVAIVLPIALPAAAVQAIKHLHRRRTLTPIHAKIEGTDAIANPCEPYTAYTARKLKLSPAQQPAIVSSGPQTRTIPGTCAAR